MTGEARQELARLWQKGARFLNVRHAIMGGAMTWVSERHLVSAISNAGGFGVLACGAMTPTLLAEEIAATQALTAAPFGVNLIVMHPELDRLIEACLDGRVGYVVLAGGLPPAPAIRRLKDGNIKVLCFAPSAGIARKLVRMGADAIIIEGMEAGGHVGPVATSVLAQEILPVIRDVPVFVAGGIGSGRGILAYLDMDAAGCQLGTRFVCAHESIAHPRFKLAFLRAQARDAVLSVQLDPRFPVIPVRALANQATRAFAERQRELITLFQNGTMEQKEAQLAIEHFWAGSLRRAVIEGDIEHGSLMAGQSVGMVVKEQSAQEIIDELVNETVSILAARRTVPAKSAIA
ncbi:MAG TPA: nitronate monooxygenase [Dongiaceae bacterium]|jgi:enoyl-[acyl-carrier protein] reductase II|nr:nitronate monooxygenase [Dongiaceae bacterium]